MSKVIFFCKYHFLIYYLNCLADMGNGKKTRTSKKSDVDTQSDRRVTLSVDERVQIIEYLKDNKNSLFDQYSSILTPSKKFEAWENAVTFAKSVNENVKDIAHLKELCNGWRKAVRTKFKDARATGNSGDVKITAADETMYSLLAKNKSLVSGYKVCNI